MTNKDEFYDIKKQILDEIEKFDSIVIMRHMRPDGDCIGSSFGLREILKESYKDKKIYSMGDSIPSYLQFLGKEDEFDLDIIKNSLVIVVDTSISKRVALPEFAQGKKIIKIDHHIAVEQYGDINLVYEDAPACCQIIVDFVNTFKDKLKINEKAAKCLYTGLVTDTGRFRFRSVVGDTLRVGGQLLDTGIDTENIYTNLNVKAPESFKLQGYVYQNFKRTENGVAYVYLTKKLMKKFGTTVEDASNLVNCMDSINGSLTWILFVDYDKDIRVRLRSRYLPIVDIASKYNGGGHANAAGATLHSKKEIKELLNLADQELKEYKLQHPEVF